MTLALEGTPVHTNNSSNTASVGPFTTANPSQVFLIVANNSGTGVISVSGGGLSWSKRVSQGGGNHIEIWTARAASALSAVTITVNYATAYTSIDLFAFSGEDTSSIFDANAAIPANSATAPVSISTSNANDVLIAGFRSASTMNMAGGSGWTKISGAHYLLSQYKIVSSTQSSFSCSSGVDGTINGSVIDALMQASASGGSVIPVGMVGGMKEMDGRING